MELQLRSTRAKKILLKEEDVKNATTSFNFNVGFSDDDKNVFAVEFNLMIADKKESYYLDSTYEAIFSTKDEIDESFIRSDFPKINAPTIAFPYFRSFISVITQQAGYSTVVLPSFNFVKLAREMLTEKE